MRNTFYLVLALVLMLSACANPSKNDGSVNTENKETIAVSSDAAVDLCKCLTEPGNSSFMQEHGEACDALISKEIGVADWKKVNMSQNKEVSDRFDALARRCSGTSQPVTTSNQEQPKVTLEEAKAFMQQRCNAINQTLMRYKTVDFNGSTMYVFMSVAQDGSVCISSVSEYKLEVLAADCGHVDVKIEQWNKL